MVEEEKELDEFESLLDEQEDDDDLEEESSEEDGSNEELVKAQELAKNYKIRAEKAEVKLKEVKKAKVVAPKKDEDEDEDESGDDTTPKKVPQEQSTLSRDEAILFAKGFDEKDVEDASFIAERKDISLSEATETLTFKALKRERDLAKKEEDSSLPASRGSKTVSKKEINDKGLTEEEHKAMWAKKVGQ